MKRLMHDHFDDAHMVDKYHMGIFIQWLRNLFAKIFGKKINPVTGVISAVIAFTVILIGRSDEPAVDEPWIEPEPVPTPEPTPVPVPVDPVPVDPIPEPVEPDPTPIDPSPTPVDDDEGELDAVLAAAL